MLYFNMSHVRLVNWLGVHHHAIFINESFKRHSIIFRTHTYLGSKIRTFHLSLALQLVRKKCSFLLNAMRCDSTSFFSRKRKVLTIEYTPNYFKIQRIRNGQFLTHCVRCVKHQQQHNNTCTK